MIIEAVIINRANRRDCSVRFGFRFGNAIAVIMTLPLLLKNLHWNAINFPKQLNFRMPKSCRSRAFSLFVARSRFDRFFASLSSCAALAIDWESCERRGEPKCGDCCARLPPPPMWVSRCASVACTPKRGAEPEGVRANSRCNCQRSSFPSNR